MAGAGDGLMAASPPGPAQLNCRCGQVLAQSGEQPADLVTGQRDELVLMGGGGLGGGQDGQERVGEQGQDGPAVPAGAVSDSGSRMGAAGRREAQ